MNFVQTLRDTALPLVLYSDPSLIGQLESTYENARGLRIRPMDEQAIRHGLWLHDRLAQLIDARADADSSQSTAQFARLRALGWLHDESIFDPHGTDGFVWIDPLLFQEVHPRYVTELGALQALRSLIDPMLLLATSDNGEGVGFSDALFGGLANTLSQVNGAYWQAYETAIDKGEVPTFDTLMKTMWRHLPGLLQRYLLQSNGLASAFFESVVAGSVSLERIHRCG